jgi:hypothetical protein
MTAFEDKAGLLGELWINYKEDEDFKDFIAYNDLGLPLAYMLAEGLVAEATPLGIQYIEETFDLFITAMEISEEDIPDGIDLQGLLEIVEKKNGTE